MKKIWYIAGSLLCASVFLLSAYQILHYYAEGAKRTEEFSGLAKVVGQGEKIGSLEEDEVLAGYAKLHQRNPDMAGWISIDGTGINYPVMYTPKEPNYYLKHNFDKEESNYGVPYIGENCNIEKTSDNLIIYSHHMKNGKMFGELMDYTDPSFYEKHRIIRFDTLKEKGEYEIFAVFKTTVGEEGGFPYYEFVDAEDEADFLNFVKSCKELAMYETDVEVRYGEKLITLSTCEYSQEDGRLVVVAKKTVL